MINREGGPTSEEMGIEQENERQLEITETAENGQWLRRVEYDENHQLVYEEVRGYDSVDAVEGDPVRYHYEKAFGFDENGNQKRETGSDKHKVNAWNKSIEYEDRQIRKETGQITEGENRGHAWEKIYETDDEGNVTKESGRITAQGDNPNKEPTGHTWEKDHKSTY